jgi:hypothetical protein
MGCVRAHVSTANVGLNTALGIAQRGRGRCQVYGRSSGDWR